MITVLKFYASWCKPCAILSGRLEDYDDIITDINIETEPDIAKQYHVRTVPTLIFFKNDVPLHRVAGLITPREFQEILDDITNSKEITNEYVKDIEVEIKQNLKNK